MPKDQLSEALVERIAARFRLLGDPLRIRILSLLREHEYCVGDLAQATGSSQATVSKHLSRLRAEGIVSTRRDGNTVWCSIGDAEVFALCETVCNSIRNNHERSGKALGFE